MSRVHIDYFGSAIGEMKRRDQSDNFKVLLVLKASPRFSVFDATDNQSIAKTLTRLMDLAFIEYPAPQPGYPWAVAAITEKGIKFMEQQQ